VAVGGLKTLDPDLPIREPEIDPDYEANKPVSIGFAGGLQPAVGAPGYTGACGSPQLTSKRSSQ